MIFMSLNIGTPQLIHIVRLRQKQIFEKCSFRIFYLKFEKHASGAGVLISKNKILFFYPTEAVPQRFSVRNIFLEISQHS